MFSFFAWVLGLVSAGTGSFKLLKAINRFHRYDLPDVWRIAYSTAAFLLRGA